jgi:hypothetical protein
MILIKKPGKILDKIGNFLSNIFSPKKSESLEISNFQTNTIINTGQTVITAEVKEELVENIIEESGREIYVPESIGYRMVETLDSDAAAEIAASRPRTNTSGFAVGSSGWLADQSVAKKNSGFAVGSSGWLADQFTVESISYTPAAIVSNDIVSNDTIVTTTERETVEGRIETLGTTLVDQEFPLPTNKTILFIKSFSDDENVFDFPTINVKSSLEEAGRTFFIEFSGTLANIGDITTGNVTVEFLRAGVTGTSSFYTEQIENLTSGDNDLFVSTSINAGPGNEDIRVRFSSNSGELRLKKGAKLLIYTDDLFEPEQPDFDVIFPRIINVAAAPDPEGFIQNPTDKILKKMIHDTTNYPSNEEYEATIVNFIGNVDDSDELLSSIFSLDKEHFTKVIFLILSKLIDIEDLRTVISMKYETRNDLLKEYLKFDIDMIYALRNFAFKVANSFSDNIVKYQVSDIQVPNFSNIIDTSLFNYDRKLFQKYSKDDPFSLVSIEDKGTYSSSFLRSSVLSTNNTESEIIILDEMKKMNINNPVSLDLKKFFSQFLNNEYPEIILEDLYFESKELPKIEYGRTFTSGNLQNNGNRAGDTLRLKDASSAVVTSINNTNYTNYFTNLYKVYNSSSPENDAEYNFDYFESSEIANSKYIKEMINELFLDVPNTIFDRKSEYYMNRYLLSFSEGINSYAQESYIKLNKSVIEPLINSLVENNYVISDKIQGANEILHFGKNRTRFMMDIITTSLRKSRIIPYTGQNLEKFPYTNLIEYLNSIENSIKDYIDANMETYSHSERIFLIFFRHLFLDYMDYLKNDSRPVDSYKLLVTSEYNLLHKSLKLIQQTFSLLPSTINRITDNQLYKNLNRSLIGTYKNSSSKSYIDYLRGVL